MAVLLRNSSTGMVTCLDWPLRSRRTAADRRQVGTTLRKRRTTAIFVERVSPGRRKSSHPNTEEKFPRGPASPFPTGNRHLVTLYVRFTEGLLVAGNSLHRTTHGTRPAKASSSTSGPSSCSIKIIVPSSSRVAIRQAKTTV